MEIYFGYFWKIFMHLNFAINMGIINAFENMHNYIDII